MGNGLAALLIMLLSGGSNDLLDAIQSDSYWNSKHVTVSVEQLIADASGRVRADVAPPHAAEVRRLIAIRTLGEMKTVEAVVALNALMESKEPFVADYAQAAIAAIEGKQAIRAPASAQDRITDVWLLPAQCELVAQIAPTGKPIGGGDIFGITAPDSPALNKQPIMEQTRQLQIAILERIGNIRLRAITVGVHPGTPHLPGYTIYVARGQYDSKAAVALLKQTKIASTNVDGMDVFQPEPLTAVLFPSDTRAVVVTAEGEDGLPLKAMVAAIKKDAGDLHDNVPMTKLIETVDTNQPVWGVVKITDAIRRIAPPADAFNLATLVVSQQDDVLRFELKAIGSDAAKVKATVEEAKIHLGETIAHYHDLMQKLSEAKRPVDDLKGAVEALESITLQSNERKATGTGSMKGPSSLSLILFAAQQDWQALPDARTSRP